METEKFPVAYWSVTENADSETFTINWSYSVDNVNFVTLKEHTGKVNGNNGIEDLAAQSGKPSGSKFLKVTVTPSGTLTGGETCTTTIKMTWWIEDQENSGVKVV
tara:strand:+ start:461 stop:775 length:315 start_codon:yes stop_codon:yes gene_type:complete